MRTLISIALTLILVTTLAFGSSSGGGGGSGSGSVVAQQQQISVTAASGSYGMDGNYIYSGLTNDYPGEAQSEIYFRTNVNGGFACKSDYGGGSVFWTINTGVYNSVHNVVFSRGFTNEAFPPSGIWMDSENNPITLTINFTAATSTGLTSNDVAAIVSDLVIPADQVNTNNASQLSSGTVADARLSRNVIINYYAGIINIGAGNGYAGMLYLSPDGGQAVLGDIDGSVNNTYVQVMDQEKIINFGSDTNNFSGKIYAPEFHGSGAWMTNIPASSIVGGFSSVQLTNGALSLNLGATNIGGTNVFRISWGTTNYNIFLP